MATIEELRKKYDSMVDAVQKSAPNSLDRHRLMEEKRAAYAAWNEANEVASRTVGGVVYQTRAAQIEAQAKQEKPAPKPAPKPVMQSARPATAQQIANPSPGLTLPKVP